MGQVTFVELALDFEAHSGRAMPASPGAELQAIVLSLHERSRVLRTALAVLQRHVTAGHPGEGCDDDQGEVISTTGGWNSSGAHSQALLHHEAGHARAAAGAGNVL